MELCELTRLSVLSLAKNQIIGSIPEEISIMRNLTGFFLAENQITVSSKNCNSNCIVSAQIAGNVLTHDTFPIHEGSDPGSIRQYVVRHTERAKQPNLRDATHIPWIDAIGSSRTGG